MHKRASRDPDFFDKQTGGWTNSTVFQKSFKANRHQELKHLMQYRCYGNRSVTKDEDGVPSELERHSAVYNKPENNPDEQAAETLH